MKRFSAFALAAACLLLAVCMIFPASAAGGYIRGDVDGDGEVTIIDATLVQRKLAGISIFSAFDERAADVNDNGLDITDATWIQRYLAGISDPYRVSEYVVETPTTPSPTRDPYELPFVPKN